jgi:GNAT superfamily N-acetyltransferase
MNPRSTGPSKAKAPRSLKLRPLRFEEIPEVLRLIRRAVEAGCHGAYDAHQRQAVWTGYAQTLFAESVGPFETIVAETRGRIVGVAQWDADDERLRALFVDGKVQRRGVGCALLAEVERSARRRRCLRLRGAMSLNAVAFYEHEGYRAYAGPEPLRTAGMAVPIVRMEKRL